MSHTPFHAGELQVQDRMGVREKIAPWAGRAVRSYLPDQHRAFYAQLPFVVAAARDELGRPWATLLAGRPGFVQSPDPHRLTIDALPVPGDALEGALTPGADVGLLGIQLETRRRNRANGTVTESSRSGLGIDVDQAFGNCPQHITLRQWRQAQIHRPTAPSSRHRRLNDPMRNWIESANTLFIASGWRDAPERGHASGMDASHRGGQPGFVQVRGQNRLVMPDYPGNNHFNSIGNLVMDPRVGLVFVDFERGSLLQITGTASIDWDSPAVAEHPGAARLIHIEVEAIVHLDAVLPFRWSEPADTKP